MKLTVTKQHGLGALIGILTGAVALSIIFAVTAKDESERLKEEIYALNDKVFSNLEVVLPTYSSDDESAKAPKSDKNSSDMIFYSHAPAENGEDIVSGDFIVRLTANERKYIIMSYTGSDSEVVIPEEINGIMVAAIASNAFKDNTSVVNVMMGSSICCIFDNAFNGCSSLKGIHFQLGQCELSAKAFNGCTSNLTVYAPYKLGIYAFCLKTGIRFELENDKQIIVLDPEPIWI